jgi:hypothetical protein
VPISNRPAEGAERVLGEFEDLELVHVLAPSGRDVLANDAVLAGLRRFLVLCDVLVAVLLSLFTSLIKAQTTGIGGSPSGLSSGMRGHLQERSTGV